MSQWPMVCLKDVAVQVARPVAPQPGTSYRQIGVRLWGAGAYERETIDGGATKYTTLWRTQEDDIIVNKIWARNGSVAVVTKELAGTVGSNEFPLYQIHQDRLLPRWFHWYTKTKAFWIKCDALSMGTSGQNRIKPEKFLTIDIPLPPLPEQRRLLERIDALAAKVGEAKRLRLQSTEASSMLPNRYLGVIVQELTASHGSTHLGNLLIEAGYGTSTKCFSDRADGATPVLRIPNVASENVTFENIKYGQLGEKELAKCSLEPGDILVVRTNGSLDLVGRSAVVPLCDEPTAFASYMIRLKCDGQRIEPMFLQLMLRHLRASGQLVDFARTTAGQYNVSLGRLRKAVIPLPGLDVQKTTVDRMNSFQNAIRPIGPEQARVHSELEAMLPAILDRAFRGELQ